MKKLIAITSAALLGTGATFAVPTLQLDISGGIYNTGDETIYSTSDAFDLVALVKPKDYNSSYDYFISVAIVPTSASGTDFGSFSFGGASYNSAGATYGNPFDGNKSHGIFDTQYFLFDVSADLASASASSQYSAEYDTQTNPGGLSPVGAPLPNKYLLYDLFPVDASGLNDGFGIHFDFLAKGEVKQGQSTVYKTVDFAPFSHDAQSGDHHGVPDGGATLALLGVGLVGLGAFRKKLAK